MMRNEMYIPKTITVGFQKRSDTFTGKLAYVIYRDHKNKLRKEGSWNGWRDKSIEAVTFDNEPTPGFTLNKGVQRDGYWGNGRSVIRVWDPRDFEFEISVDNLIGILMHSDVSKRDITEPCVFAWYGTELVLLPTNSVEYQESVKYTEKQTVKFSTKSLVVGHTYEQRRGGTDVVYLGRLETYTKKLVTAHDGVTMVNFASKGLAHRFITTDGSERFAPTPSALISRELSDELHPEFATLMDKYFASETAQPVVGLTINPRGGDRYYSDKYIKIDDNTFMSLTYAHNYGGWGRPATASLTISEVVQWDPATHMITRTSPQRSAQVALGVPRGVVDKLEQLKPIYDERVKVASAETNRYVDHSAIISQIAKEQGAGILQLVLTDGKLVDTDYSLFYK